MTEFLYHAALPLLLGLGTITATVIAGLTLGAARHWKLPTMESCSVPAKLALLLLLNPGNWLGVWAIGLPLFLVLKHWG